MRVALTGGAGYIGSHVVVALIEAGHHPIVVDDLSNSSSEVLHRIEQITGVRPPLVIADAANVEAVDDAFRAHGPVDAVIHLAGLKSVGQSTLEPARYYNVNVGSAAAVLQAMRIHGVSTFVFSSSATVYGNPVSLPLREGMTTSLDLANPYGKTKRIIEELISDTVASDPELRAVSLRYFNPVGAHPSGLIGEDPKGRPTNLMPIITKVAQRELEAVQVFGDDYDTADGTGERDYIHVVDLARGHVAALEGASAGHSIYNLGTGTATSVLELIRDFETATATSVPFTVAPRRPGDVAIAYADPSLAEKELGWAAQLSIEDACRDAWRWQSANPHGFEV